MISYTDIYDKGTQEFDYIFDSIFKDYLQTNKIELIRYDRYTEEYLINNKHKAVCHFNNGNCYRIVTTRRI